MNRDQFVIFATGPEGTVDIFLAQRITAEEAALYVPDKPIGKYPLFPCNGIKVKITAE
jgi:hypothetical protein